MRRKRHVRWRRALAVVGGVTMLAALTSVASASAQSSQGVDTSATVGGGTNAPTIECGWALNDVNHNWTDLMQYGQDDSAATPGGPCAVSGNRAAQADNVSTPLIHVLPNAHDDPTQAYVELWGAVDSSTTQMNVYWDVYHPGAAGDGTGSFKVQVDGTRYADSTTPARCAGPSGMFAAAQSTGQITSGAVTNIQNECQFQQKSIWYGAFGISKHQPYGLYRIVMHAANAGGQEVTLTYYIQVQSFYQLEKDFTAIDFGNVTANGHFWQPVAGDFTWDGTNNAANQASSVRNTGNAGIGLDVDFHSLCLTTAASCTDDKRIDHFDAKFGKTISGLQAMGNVDLATSLTSNLASTAKPAPAGQTYTFDNDINRTLCPNDIGKIEFSIWTEVIQAGTYTASPGIDLIARPNAICSTDLGEPYNAPATPTAIAYWP